MNESPETALLTFKAALINILMLPVNQKALMLKKSLTVMNPQGVGRSLASFSSWFWFSLGVFIKQAPINLLSSKQLPDTVRDSPVDEVEHLAAKEQIFHSGVGGDDSEETCCTGKDVHPRCSTSGGRSL